MSPFAKEKNDITGVQSNSGGKDDDISVIVVGVV